MTIQQRPHNTNDELLGERKFHPIQPRLWLFCTITLDPPPLSSAEKLTLKHVFNLDYTA